MADIELKHTADGADYVLKGSDISVSSGIQNAVYLALFGGDKSPEDWWGNSLVSQDLSLQFSSGTQSVLADIAVNGAGRLRVEQAVKSDLSHLSNIADISVSVVVNSTNSIAINLTIKEPSGSDVNLSYIWDVTKSELNA